MEKEPPVYPSSIYLNIGALVNFPSGLQIGYEQHLKDKWYWDIEGGVLIFNDPPSLNDFRASNKRGLRFQSGVKKYVDDNFYFGLELLYRHLRMEEDVWLSRYDGKFYQRMEVERRRNTSALILEGGWTYPIKESRFAIDLAYGFGIQNLFINYLNIPDDVVTLNFAGIIRREGSAWYPFFNYRLKLKYSLGQGNPYKESSKSIRRKKKRR